LSGNSATSIFHTSHVFAGGSRGASEKSFCFSESDAKGLTSLKYIFESTSGATSRLRLEVWVKDNFAVRLEASLVNLAGVLKCQQAAASIDKAGPAES